MTLLLVTKKKLYKYNKAKPHIQYKIVLSIMYLRNELHPKKNLHNMNENRVRFSNFPKESEDIYMSYKKIRET